MSVATVGRERVGSGDLLGGHPMLRETLGVTVALCSLVPALLPMSQHGLAATHDGLLHVQRLVALDSTLRQGAPFTRWLPDLAYGYGQPLLLYYASLSYLPGVAAHALGFGFATSVEIASALALVCSTVAMYVLARSLFETPAASAAAAVYGLLPYQLVDVYVRGALAESWAFVWLPLCSWCLLRAVRDGRPRWSVGLALCLAGLILTHNVTALLFLPALLLMALCLAARSWRSSHLTVVRPLVAIGLGLALSAWFWLPALAEKSLVQIGETIEPELFASFFLRGWPPFRLDWAYDYERPVSTALGSPIFWPQLGAIQVVITVAGTAAVARMKRSGAEVGIWASLLVVGGFALQLAPFAPLYSAVPLLAFVQFPWRLLAVVGLGSAVLAGVLVESVVRRLDIRIGVAALVVAASLVTAVARLDPEMQPIDEAALTVASIGRAEMADYHLGTTHSGEYLPVSSGQRNANRLRKTILDAGSIPARGGEQTSTALRVETVDWRPDGIGVQVTAATADRLLIHQFAFPGWSASVDGATAPVVASGPLGLVGVDVPPGRHTVQLSWGWTTLRLATAVGSLLALAALAVLGARPFWRPRPRPLATTVVLALAVGVLVVPSWSGRPRSADDASAGGGPLPIDDALTLLDSEVDRSRLGSDRLVLVRQVWQTTRAVATGYRAALEAVAPDGTAARAPWTYEPLSRLWVRGELVPTNVALRLPAWFPPGEAALRLVFEQPSGIQPLALGRIVVSPTQASSNGSNTSDSVEPIPGVRLDGISLPRSRQGGPVAVRAGGALDLALRWSQAGVLPDPAHDLLVVAAILTPGGDLLSEPRRTGDWFAPLPFWNTGEKIEQRLRVSVPPGTVSGTYPVLVRLYAVDLARGGMGESGASSVRPRGRPVAQLAAGEVTIAR